MSIFEKYPNLEEVIKNSDDEDYIFDSLAKLFQEFLNNYSNNFSKEKIKQFYLDSKKLFIFTYPILSFPKYGTLRYRSYINRISRFV